MVAILTNLLAKHRLAIALALLTALVLAARLRISGTADWPRSAQCLTPSLAPFCSDDQSCMALLPGASALQQQGLKSIVSLAAPHTMVSEPRLRAAQQAIRYIVSRGVGGDLVETGVARGGCSALLALTSTALGSPRRVHLYDTFGAPPPPTSKDGAAAMAWVSEPGPSEEEVRASLASLGVPVAVQTTFHAGNVLRTPLEDLPCRIALLRVDTDWAASYSWAFEHLYPRVVPGGVVILDDYGFWEGARKATDHFLALPAQAGIKLTPVFERDGKVFSVMFCKPGGEGACLEGSLYDANRAAPLVRSCPPLAQLSIARGAASLLTLAQPRGAHAEELDILYHPLSRALDASGALNLCLSIAQPRAVFVMRPDLPERLALQFNQSAAAADLEGSPVAHPDTLRLRVRGGALDEELPAACNLLTPPQGAQLWAEDGALEAIPNYNWAFNSERCAESVQGTLDIPAPLFATQYICTVAQPEMALLAARAQAQQLPLLSVHLLVHYRAFAWHAQPALQGNCGAQGVGPLLHVAVQQSPLSPPPLVLFLHPSLPPSAPQQQLLPPPLCLSAEGGGIWEPLATPGVSLSSGGGRTWGFDPSEAPSQPQLYYRARGGCALRSLTVAQVGTCLATRWPRMRLIGDSNIRRTFKTLWGLLPRAGSGEDAANATGSAWCSGRRGDKVCVCEDFFEDGAFGIPGETYGDPLFLVPVRGRDAASGEDFFLSFSWFGPFGADMPHGGVHSCYSWEQGLRARLQAQLPNDVLVLDVGNWDAAFSQLAYYERQLAALVTVLAEVLGLARVDRGEALAPALAGLPNVGEAGWAEARARAHAIDAVPPLLVLRTPNFYGGFNAASCPGYVNTASIALVSARTVDALRGAFGGVQLLVWDVQAMARALPLERSQAMAARCRSNHATSEDMEQQVQVLLNALCN